MKSKKPISARRYLAFFFSFLAIPLSFFLLIYNIMSIRTIQSMNIRIADTGHNLLELVQTVNELELDKITASIAYNWAKEINHINIKRPTDVLSLHYSLNEIGSVYRNIISQDNYVTVLGIYAKNNNCIRVWGEDGRYNYRQYDAISKHIEDILKNKTIPIQQGWVPLQIENNHFLVKVIGFQDAATAVMVDMDKVCQFQDAGGKANGGSFNYYLADGSFFAGNDTAHMSNIAPNKLNERYFITAGKERFLVTNSQSAKHDLRLVLFMPYTLNNTLNCVMQVLLFLVSILVICMVPVCYRLISASFLQPLNQLSQSIQRVRDGEADERHCDTYRIEEFLHIDKAFYKMIDEIKSLKIASYENELHSQRMQMQYLQLQIKPHFFLNCLKNIYSLVELKQFGKIQRMVILISQYLRNRFNDSTQHIPLDDEMENVRNYVELQNLTAVSSAILQVKGDSGLEQCLVPAMIVQPFVENALKYARQEKQELCIEIRLQRLVADSLVFLDISVSDNGPGFSEVSLKMLSGNYDVEAAQNHIGINNVRQRLKLIYGEAASVHCYNAHTGARCEMIIPMVGCHVREEQMDEYYTD